MLEFVTGVPLLSKLAQQHPDDNFKKQVALEQTSCRYNAARSAISLTIVTGGSTADT